MPNLKELSYSILHRTRLIGLYQRTIGWKTGMLCYHNVLPDKNFSRRGRYHTDFPVSVMEHHLRFLVQDANLRPFPEVEVPQVILSFDDGMLNNYHIVRPLLQRYGVKAMFAVCPDLIDGKIPHIWRDHVFLILRQLIGKSILLPVDDYSIPQPVNENTIPVLETQLKQWVYQNRLTTVYETIQEICLTNRIAYKKEDYDPLRFDCMNWKQIRQLYADGHVIVSHTCSHRILSFLSAEQKRQEMIKSRFRIEEMIQAPVDTIVYPYGNVEEVDEQVLKTAADCGYQYGYLNMQRSFAPDNFLAKARFGLPFTVNKSYMAAITSGLHNAIKDKLSVARFNYSQTNRFISS